MTTDHGAAGFCTDHAQAPDERTETVARVAYRALYPGHINTHDSARTPESDAAERDRAYETWDAGREGYAPGRTCRDLAAAVVAALDDETACSVCDRADDVRADATRHAGWVEAMRFAHHAHAPEPGECFMSANGVLGAGPDAVIVDGDWLAQVEADLAADRAALDRVRAVCAQIEAMPIPADPGMSQTAITGRIVATITRAVRAALDPEEPQACDRGPCHLPRGHDGRCNPGRDALPETEEPR